MPKILSFEVSDEFYQRIVVQQEKEGLTFLSPFLRTLINTALIALEHQQVKEPDNAERTTER